MIRTERTQTILRRPYDHTERGENLETKTASSIGLRGSAPRPQGRRGSRGGRRRLVGGRNPTHQERGSPGSAGAAHPLASTHSDRGHEDHGRRSSGGGVCSKSRRKYRGSLGAGIRRDHKGVCGLSLIHISEPTRRTPISYAVFCLKKKKQPQTTQHN